MSNLLKKINVSIIGLGRISSNHLSSLKILEDKFTIDYLCDIDNSVLSNYKNLDVNISNNLEKLINTSNSDLYVLCTPSGLHPKQAVRLINSGKNVLSEKPMATSLKGAKQILKALDNNPLSRFFTVKQNRFNPTVIKLKDIIDLNLLGDIYNINCNVFWTRPQEYYDQAKWRGTKELDGGAFLNQASHYFDLLIYFFGSVKSVFAYTKTFARKIEMEDSGVVVIEFNCGALCTVNVTMLTFDQNYEGSITVIAEKGTIKLGGKALNNFEFFKIDCYDDNLNEYNYSLDSVYGFGHIKLYESIYNSLISGKENQLEGNAGEHSLVVILAAYKSSVTGKKIMIENFIEK